MRLYELYLVNLLTFFIIIAFFAILVLIDYLTDKKKIKCKNIMKRY